MLRCNLLHANLDGTKQASASDIVTTGWLSAVPYRVGRGTTRNLTVAVLAVHTPCRARGGKPGSQNSARV